MSPYRADMRAHMVVGRVSPLRSLAFAASSMLSVGCNYQDPAAAIASRAATEVRLGSRLDEVLALTRGIGDRWPNYAAICIERCEHSGERLFTAFRRTDGGSYIEELAICEADGLTRRESMEQPSEAAAEKAIEAALKNCPTLEVAWGSWSVVVHFDSRLAVRRVGLPQYSD